MIRYFLRALAAHFHSGRSLFFLTSLGVALGVASVVSIQVINLNALGAFEGSVEAVSGDAELIVVGRTPRIPEGLYPEALGVPGVEAAWPIYRAEVALPRGDEERHAFLEVVGVDLFAPRKLPWKGQPGALSSALAEPGWVAVTPELALEMGWSKGDRFEVTLGSRRIVLRVGALVDFRKQSPLASSRLAVMDIAQAQSALGGGGEINQIDVRVAPGASRDAVREKLAATLGPGVRVLTAQERENEAASLSRSFRLNLTALSLISLFVGGFLVFSSTQASLVRRRTEFGLLRSVGATRRQLLGLILGEALLLGLLGVAVGLPLGYLGAASYVDRVSATLSNVYLLQRIETLTLPAWLFPLAGALGITGALVGSILPALDISRRDTRALLAPFTLHERMSRAALPLFILGIAVVALSIAIWAVARPAWRPGGFVLAVGLLLSLPLLTPLVVQRSARRVPVRRFDVLYGVKGLGRELQTTPFAIAALAIAVSMLMGITIMVGSFRRTLEIWIDTTIRADVYITSPSWRRGADAAALDPELVSSLARMDGVRARDRLRQFFAYVGDRRILLAGVDMSLAIRHRFTLLEGDPEEALRRLHEGAVLVGEPLARKASLAVGDPLVLATRDGPKTYSVAGIYYDYGNEQGGAFMDLETMNRDFGPGPVTNVALYLEPGVDPERFVDEIKSRYPQVPLEVRSNRRLREQVFRLFDQTFAVTRLLQMMSLLIAVSGITLTLLVVARERVSELALYRALGAERRQLFLTYLGKGAGMALYGLALGGAGGLLLALILVHVINRAYFGWTIALHWPVESLVSQTFLILAAAVMASLYPALRASRTPATELRREDL